MKTSEERLLGGLFGGMTEEESKYLAWLLPRVGSSVSTERARELFHRKFPDSKWLHYPGK